MKVAIVTIIAALSVTPAMAQGFGKSRKQDDAAATSPQEIAKKKAAEAAYRKSIGNIPDKKPDNDPWRNAR